MTGDGEQTGLAAAGSSPSVVEDLDTKSSSYKASVSVASTVTSPPPRPRPAPRLWTEPSPTANSLHGLETTIAPRHIVDTMSSNSLSPLFIDILSRNPETRSPVSRFSPRSKNKSLSSRRKGSVPDLELSRSSRKLRAVDESSLDSRMLNGSHLCWHY